MNDLTSKVTRHVMSKRRRVGRAYDSIKIINRILRSDLPVNDRIGLLTLKVSEMRLAGYKNEVLDVIKQYISLTPVHAEPWMLLAGFYRDDLDCPRRATLVADIAVAMAKLDGNFVRQALGEKMRTLLVAGKSSEANECLLAIMNTDVPNDSVDIAFEDDFLSHPNAHELDAELVREYRNVGLNRGRRPPE